MTDNTNEKRFVNIAIGAMLVCTAVDLFWMDAGFRWIAYSGYLGKDKYPWVPTALGIVALISAIVGSLLFIVCLIAGTNRQRIISAVPGLVLLWFLWWFIRGIVLYGF